jgi:hypothetical protein
VRYHDWYGEIDPDDLLEDAVSGRTGGRYLGVNTYDGKQWFSRERFGDFVLRMYACALMTVYSRLEGERALEEELRIFRIAARWIHAKDDSGYEVGRLLANIERNPEKN